MNRHRDFAMKYARHLPCNENKILRLQPSLKINGVRIQLKELKTARKNILKYFAMSLWNAMDTRGRESTV